jgi:hypothetical protein
MECGSLGLNYSKIFLKKDKKNQPPVAAAAALAVVGRVV